MMTVSGLTLAQTERIAINSVAAPRGAPVLLIARYASDNAVVARPTAMVLRFAYPTPLFSEMEVVADASLALAGKTFDHEKSEASLHLAVFGGREPVPTGPMFQLRARIGSDAPVGQIVVPNNVLIQGADADAAPVAVALSGGAVVVSAASDWHDADASCDWRISLNELLRLVQFYHAGAYHCDAESEDGFAPGAGEVSCGYHDADYNPADGRISFMELLRMIQLYNAPHAAYHSQPGAEDGFSPGPFGYEE